MEDYQIVDLYWSRSEQAIEQSERKYGRMLQSISLSLLHSAQDAEECVSDTYIAAWNRMPEERPQYLGAFLSKIVRHISISRFRREHRQKRGGMDNFVEELSECIPTGTTVQQEYENGRLAQTLNRFLYGMEEQRRAVFLRRYFYGQSIEQISAEMGIKAGSVKSMLFRSREALRLLLEKEELL